jgi:hypothetical protein
MSRIKLSLSVWLLLSCFAVSLSGQQAVPAAANAVVPPLIKFSGTLTDVNGNALAGTVGLTFSLYKESQGGAPLWVEIQNVSPDKAGHYSVMLGSTTSQGIPAELFVSGEARWLGVQAQGQTEQPRTLLMSVPYALKAADAQTLGGLPPSAFVLAAPPNSGSSSSSPANGDSGANLPSSGVTGSGTADYLPLWTSGSNIGNSVLYQSGSGSAAKVGINTTTPASTLDVKGGATVRGLFSLPAAGTATATAGKNSQPIKLSASSFNSGTGTAVTQNFEWQAEPVGNDTSSASGTLNLLFGQGSNKASETGLNIASNGQITFAKGQAFPGAGTVTSVGSGAGLTGGPITGSGTLSIANGGVTNAMLQNSSLTVTAGTDLTGGGAVSLGGNTTLNVDTTKVVTGVVAGTDLTGGGTGGVQTLNLDTTKVPQLGTANTFTGNQTVNGSLTATGVVTGSSYQIGSNLFAFGSYANANAFLGFSGNPAATGGYNTGIGSVALQQLTTGAENTAIGYEALQGNTAAGANTATGYAALGQSNSGSFNTASGVQALYSNTTGYQNTATGVAALYANTTGYYNTATGLDSLRYNTTGFSNTAHGYAALYSNTTGSPNDAFGFEALQANTVGTDNVALGYQALHSNVGDSAGDGWYNTAVGYQALYMNNDTSGIGIYANNNVAIGTVALHSNTTGFANTASGSYALNSTTTGCCNAASGTAALQNNSTGSNNTAVGYGAIVENSTGNDNTGVGYDALLLSNGNDLTCIGFECGADADGLSNATAIGAHARVGTSNSLVLGGTGKYAVKVGIGTTTPSNILTIAQGAGHPVSDGWETFSSRRWKTNIQTLHGALGKVEQLRGVSYDLKANGKHEVGVIAEEVGAVVPEVVTYEDNGKDARSVDYTRLTALLIEATKEQQREIQQERAANEEQRREIQSQAAVIRELKSDLRATRQTLEKVKAQLDSNQPTVVAAN